VVLMGVRMGPEKGPSCVICHPSEGGVKCTQGDWGTARGGITR